MIAFSLVVTAPKGISKCLISDTLVSEADGAALELVIADGSEDIVDISRPGLQHIRLPGRAVFTLRRTGLSHASNDWIVLLEDHCKPMPGLLAAFSNAIRNYPAVDLFSGAIENKTSTSPWSWANVLYTGHRFFSFSHRRPRTASISNLAIRRSALCDSELAHDGGFEVLTLPRLTRSGRYMHCAGAVVDHVQPRTWSKGCATHFHNARCHGAFQRALRDKLGRAWLVESVWAFYGITVRPLRIMLDLRATEHFKLSTLPKLVLLGLAAGAGRLWGLLTGPGLSAQELD
jgi:hypothetical protein